MRSAIAFIVAAMMLATPLAAARAPPPASIVVVAAPGAPILISWSPVIGAEAYVVFAGIDAAHLEEVATVSGNFLAMGEGSAPARTYGVASIVKGIVGDIHQTDSGDGDCVAANSNGHVAVMVSNCVQN